MKHHRQKKWGGGAKSPSQEKVSFLHTNLQTEAVRHSAKDSLKTKASFFHTHTYTHTNFQTEAVRLGEESPLKAKTLFRPGLSLIGVLTTSAIGMIIVAGMSQYLIQMKIQFSDKEKTAKRLSIHSFIGRRLENSQACYHTLNPGTLTPAVSAGDTAPFPEQKFQITHLKDSKGDIVLNFETYKSGDTIPTGKAIGDLKDSATVERLHNLGIDKFEKLEFVYDKDTSSHGRVVLHSRTELKGFHEKRNPPIVWELWGISVESNKVSLCTESAPLKILCGSTAVGRPHGNGGGFVEDGATVDSTAYIGPWAVVCGSAKVKGNAKVFGNAQITGSAEVSGNALIYDSAKISGSAKVKGNAKVYDNAKVEGSAKVFGSARVFNQAVVKGRAHVYDTAQVYKSADVWGDARVYTGTTGTGARVFDSARVGGDARIFNSASVYGLADVAGDAEIFGNARIYDSAKITDTAKVYGSARVYGDGNVYDRGRVYGSARVMANGVGDDAHVFGNAIVESYVLNTARVGGNIATLRHNIKGTCECTHINTPADCINMHVTGVCASGTCNVVCHRE